MADAFVRQFDNTFGIDIQALCRARADKNRVVPSDAGELFGQFLKPTDCLPTRHHARSGSGRKLISYWSPSLPPPGGAPAPLPCGLCSLSAACGISIPASRIGLDRRQNFVFAAEEDSIYKAVIEVTCPTFSPNMRRTADIPLPVHLDEFIACES